MCWLARQLHQLSSHPDIMAPATIRNLLGHLSAARTIPPDPQALGPLAARALLLARDGTSANMPDPHHGVTDVSSINNPAVFVLFGLIGAAFVVTGIWFFFWAKNGGFSFRQTDWDDYKSTVLRRKGPNGTILSGATPSTNLGGGSIYKDVDDGSTEDATTVVSGTTGVTGITGGVSDFLGREKRRKKREQKEHEKEREKERRREEGAEKKLTKKKGDKKKSSSKSRKVNNEGVLIDEEAEALAQEQLRCYRHEKAARVGGLNKESDASHWDGSTNPSGSTATPTTAESTVTSDLLSHRETTPTRTPPSTRRAQGGIRKVYSTADRTADRETERIRAEARRLQEMGRAAASRRDFSYQRAEERTLTPTRTGGGGSGVGGVSGSRAESDVGTHIPGGWTETVVSASDVGTKAYHHVIPGISVSGGSHTGAPSTTAESDFAYQDEGRKKGRWYRRPRADE